MLLAEEVADMTFDELLDTSPVSLVLTHDTLSTRLRGTELSFVLCDDLDMTYDDLEFSIYG